MAARSVVRVNELTVRPIDANLIKVIRTTKPSWIPNVTATRSKSDLGGRSGGYRGAR